MSALSSRQRWGQCPVSETTENLKGGEAEKKLQKAQEGTGQGTLSTRTLMEKQQPFLHALVWPSDAATRVALCEGSAHQPA